MQNKQKTKYVRAESLKSTDRLNLNKAVLAPEMPYLKPTTVTVNLRMSATMVNELKLQANKNDVPYQSYMKILLAQALKSKTA